MAVEAQRPPAPVGARGGLVLAILAASAWAVWQLDLEFAQLFPEGARLQILKQFFLGAFSPDLSGAVLTELGHGVWRTIEFAVAAMTFAVVIGTVLGFFASSAWWSEEKRAETTKGALCFVCLRSTVFPLMYVLARAFIALFRSIHELFWAVLFLAAIGGADPANGVFAIAIPYGCTLAKVFSEMVDEAPRESAAALREIGAGPMQVYCFGHVPSALPDMVAYTFYRFECTLRSAAILGFLGFETLGHFIMLAFKESDYGQTWTFLYALLALVIAADWWSGAFRRSFVT